MACNETSVNLGHVNDHPALIRATRYEQVERRAGIIEHVPHHRDYVPRNELDAAYAERNAVVLAFARLAVMVGWRVGVLRDENEPDWPVLMVDTHAGQVSWHLKADELPPGEFDTYPGTWDGHSTPEKYNRLACIGMPPADPSPGQEKTT